MIKRLQMLGLLLGALTAAAVAVIVVRYSTRPLVLAVLFGATLIALLVTRWWRRRIPANTVLELDLEQGIVEHTPSDPVARALTAGSLTLRNVVDALDRAAGDDRVTGLIARLGTAKLGLAQAQELRDGVKRFRSGGKRAVAFAETFGEGRLATIPYYLATAFDEIHLQPGGEVNVAGLVNRRPYLRSMFDRFDVFPDFDHRREYKSAMYLFTESELTAPDHEARTAILESQFEQIVSGIAGDRGIDPDRVRELIDEAPLSHLAAREAGLVDHLSYRDEAYTAAQGESGRLLFAHRYLKRARPPHRKGKKVALIYGTGAIALGKPGFDPLTGGSSMAADAVSAAFRAAIDDKKVKAILFRVDSPGGSAVASEVIRRETARAQEKGKPVVVSMGNVAGSGGYWVSMTADKIIAQPATVTGSIGVVAGKLVTAPAWAKGGVNWREMHIGRNATFMSPDRPFSEGEREWLAHYLDGIYEDFTSRVAAGRQLDPDAVEEIAKGRVWTGADALERNLVDELGGMDRALEVAKEAAGIAPDEPVKLVVYPKARTPLLPRRTESSEDLATATRSILGLLDVLLAGTGTRDVVRMPGW